MRTGIAEKYFAAHSRQSRKAVKNTFLYLKIKGKIPVRSVSSRWWNFFIYFSFLFQEHISEDLRSTLNAFLYRTGESSRKWVTGFKIYLFDKFAIFLLNIKQHYFLKIKQKLFGKIIPSSVQNMYMLKMLHLYKKLLQYEIWEIKKSHEIFD